MRVRLCRENVIVVTAVTGVHSESPTDARFTGYRGRPLVGGVRVALVNDPAGAIGNAVGDAVIDGGRPGIHLVTGRSDPELEGEGYAGVRVILG
jgi:hypothetical protein